MDASTPARAPPRRARSPPGPDREHRPSIRDLPGRGRGRSLRYHGGRTRHDRTSTDVLSRGRGCPALHWRGSHPSMRLLLPAYPPRSRAGILHKGTAPYRYVVGANGRANSAVPHSCPPCILRSSIPCCLALDGLSHSPRRRPAFVQIDLTAHLVADPFTGEVHSDDVGHPQPVAPQERTAAAPRTLQSLQLAPRWPSSVMPNNGHILNAQPVDDMERQ